MSYLRRLPVRIVKLDRSLVASMLTERRSATIVRSMGIFCREAGLDALAEGIEDEVVAQACRAAGTGFGQGWLRARGGARTISTSA